MDLQRPVMLVRQVLTNQAPARKHVLRAHIPLEEVRITVVQVNSKAHVPLETHAVVLLLDIVHMIGIIL